MSMKTKPLRRTTFKNLKICLLKWTYICVHYRLELPLCRWKWHWYNIWYMFVFSWSPHPHKSYHRPTRNARPKIPAGLKILRASEGDHRPWFMIIPAGLRKLWKSFPIESLKLTFVFVTGSNFLCVTWNEIDTIFGTCSCSCSLPTSTSPITRRPGTPGRKFRWAWK